MIALHLCAIAYTSWRQRSNLVTRMLPGRRARASAGQQEPNVPNVHGPCGPCSSLRQPLDGSRTDQPPSAPSMLPPNSMKAFSFTFLN
jgi:hypothetical protein